MFWLKKGKNVSLESFFIAWKEKYPSGTFDLWNMKINFLQAFEDQSKMFSGKKNIEASKDQRLIKFVQELNVIKLCNRAFFE